MTITDLFNTTLPAALAKNPTINVPAIFLFRVDAEAWTLDLKSKPPTCTSGTTGRADATVEISGSDLEDILKDPNCAMALFMGGKIKVSGNMMLAMQLKDVFALMK